MVFPVIVIAFIVGVAVGAFSHKYLAVQVKAVTGQDAQALADKVKSKV